MAAIFLSWPVHARKSATIKSLNQPVEVSRAPRPVYPYSVVPGGAYDASELRTRLKSDEVAARHYEPFQLAALKSVQSKFTSPVYVSYRKDNQIYWTRKPVRLTPDETLLTDGTLYARARCGNRISESGQVPVAEADPPAYVLDVPDSYRFSPVALPETSVSQAAPAQPADTAARVPDESGSWPISSGLGLLMLPRGRSSSSPAGPGSPGSSGSSGTPGPVRGGPGTPITPGTPGSGNSGPGTSGSPGNRHHGNGGSGSPGTQGTPAPGGGGTPEPGDGVSGDPCCPATPPDPGISTEDPGTPALPDPISGGTDDPGTPKIPPSDPGDGWSPSPPPLTPVPEPGSVVLLLTAVATITGIHVRRKRRSGSPAS